MQHCHQPKKQLTKTVQDRIVAALAQLLVEVARQEARKGRPEKSGSKRLGNRERITAETNTPTKGLC